MFYVFLYSFISAEKRSEMNENSTLNNLAETYLDAAGLQTALIGQNREKMRLSKSRCDRKEEMRLKRLLCLLYRQKRELLETANYLRNYYRFSSQCLKA